MEKEYMLYLGLGFEFAGLVVTFLFLGQWLDQKYQWQGLGIAAGAFLGIAIWILHLVLVMRAVEKKKNQP
jgi:hypothetical protein